VARCSSFEPSVRVQASEPLIRFRTLAIWSLVLLCDAGCTATRDETSSPSASLPAPAQVLPVADALEGWTRDEAPRTYDRDTLYDFMNGAADLYFTYGFESLAVGDYQGPDGTWLRVEVYRTVTDADAYGLFAYNAYGEPIDLGVQGRWASESRLSFWQSRTYVQITARDAVDDAALQAFGHAVSAALPASGTSPAIVQALPLQNLLPDSVRFFREQMALENYLWLGPDNVPGLGSDTEGALGTYTLEAGRATLLLVVFPGGERAEAARQGLVEAGVAELVVARIADRTLGAVFGDVDAGSATALLEGALAAVG
jgi:hypothetical protein